MTTFPSLGRSTERTLYYGALGVIAACGLGTAVSAALGNLRLALALSGVIALAAAVVVPLHAMRSRRFMDVALRRGGGRIRRPSSAPAAPAAARTAEMGPEAMAMLTRLNRQVAALAERSADAPAAQPLAGSAVETARLEETVERSAAQTRREVEILRAELALVARQVAGRDAAGPA